MLELFIQFLSDLVKPFFSLDSMDERAKKKYYKHLTRLVINMSSLSDNLDYFCQSLEKWKDDIRSYKMGFSYCDKVPNLNKGAVYNIAQNISNIEEDISTLAEWLKVAEFMYNGTDFEKELRKFIEFKRHIFGLWGLLLKENCGSCCATEEDHIAIPSYSILLTGMTIKDLAIGCHEAFPYSARVMPFQNDMTNEKALFYKDYGYFREIYNYEDNLNDNEEYKYQIECIKYFSTDEADEEIDSVIQATVSAKKELDEMVQTLRNKIESLIGDNKSDVFLYL